MEFMSILLMQTGLISLSFLLGTVFFFGYVALVKIGEKNTLLVILSTIAYNTILGYIVLYPWLIGGF